MTQPRLIVVDDEPGIIELFRDFLTERYEIRTFLDGNDIKENDFLWADVLISDFKMPGKTGVDVLEEMYCLGIEIPCLFVSAYISEAHENLKVGHVVDFIEKPINFEHLEQMVDLFYDYKKSIDQLEEKATKLLQSADISFSKAKRNVYGVRNAKLLKLKLEVEKVKRAAGLVRESA